MSEEDNGDVHGNVAPRRRWDVFLNFRGEDTRRGFVIPLRRKLEEKGVRAFFDDEGLRQGDSLDPVLYEAIRDSGAAIAIISPKYASSRWCLEELAAMVDCRRLILPVFYDVDPSDVRGQRGPFEADFRKLEEKFGAETVGGWRNAMTVVGNLKGQVFNKSWDPSELIQVLVNDIWSELRNTPMFVAPHIVGLHSQINNLMISLNPRSKNTIILGLHGIGGVGKTTLAKALFNKLVADFENRSFISNVRATSDRPHGLASLRNKLAKDLSGAGDKPVLVVLDDVDQEHQLRLLVGETRRFGEGSRVIVSTRNEQVLVPSLVDKAYEVKELGLSDSLELFSYHAFRMQKPMEEFSGISARIVSAAGRLPLALEVFGSLLYDQRSLEEWEDTLNLLKRDGSSQVQKVLRVSYDGLDGPQKQVFLDISCLLLEMETARIEDAIDLLEGSCGVGARRAIGILIRRSLLKVKEGNELWMHDQIREMGRQIVRGENRLDASRLWEHREILRILQDRAGTERIEGIILNLANISFRSDMIMTVETIASNNIRRGRPNWTSLATYLKMRYDEFLKRLYSSEVGQETVIRTESFQKMKNLRYLHLGNVKLEGDFRNMPPNLKCLQWKHSPLKSLPSSACPRELSVLDLSESKIETLWAWWHNVPENLMIMNLYGCHNLRSIPNLTRNTALRKLNLERCKSLRTIHRSVGDLTMLRYLNLKDCSSLVKFPEDVSGLKLLENLNLSGCFLIKELPEGIDSMFSLRELVLDKTAITKLPGSIVRLTKLEKLDLCSCKSLTALPVGIGNLGSLRTLLLDDSSLKNLPDSIGSLKNLHELSLRRCASLSMIPDSIGKLISLKSFWLTGTSVAKVPSSVGSLHYLQNLSLATCSQINALPVSIHGLAFLTELSLDGTSIHDLPDQIEGLKSLETLEMINCTYFKSLPQTVGKLLGLKTLIIVNTAIEELPESIGYLEQLSFLNLNKNGQLHRLPKSTGKLKSLHHLLMEKTAIFELPGSFGELSNLRTLKMSKTSSHNDLKTFTELPSSFSDLSLLQELDAKACGISGKIPDEFQNLSSLESLNLGHNNLHSLPSSLRGLSFLTEISLEHCKLLQVLPPLPSCLVKLNASDCTSLERITDLSNLEHLKKLDLTNCERLQHIEGLECLKSLRWLYMFGCNACRSDAEGKLNKSIMKNLHHLSMPGSSIPDWFTRSMISCSIRRNYVVKAVIIIVVVSVNHEIEELRHQLPVTPGVQAKILRLGEPVYSTTLFLQGVPKTYQDQVYLCRYAEYHPLVTILRDGDEIHVALQKPPCVPGVELKASGIHLVFENEDDFDGDERLLDEKYKSASERLTRYIKTPEKLDAGTPNRADEERNRHRVRCLSAFGLALAALFPLIVAIAWYHC